MKSLRTAPLHVLLALSLPLLGSCSSTARAVRDVTDTSTRPVTYLLTLDIKSGQLEAFETLMAELISSTRGEPGTLMYEWYTSADKETVQILERFADTAAYQAHLDAFAPFAARFIAAVEVRSFTVYGDPDSEAREGLSGLNPTYLLGIGGFAR